MKEPFIVQDLNQIDCGNPECPGGHPVYLFPRCHRDAGVDVGYDKDRGVLLVQCHICRTPICEIAVAAATTH